MSICGDGIVWIIFRLVGAGSAGAGWLVPQVVGLAESSSVSCRSLVLGVAFALALPWRILPRLASPCRAPA